MGAVRHLIEFLDEHRALGLQAVDDKAVVDNFVPDINRCAMLFEGELDNLDRTVNARAKPARSGEQKF
jgi:hypothetical protein